MDPELVELHSLLVRDLRHFRTEAELAAKSGTLFAPPPGHPNPVGSLALHVAGNLQHFVGAQLGGSGYLRDRESEFRRRTDLSEVLAQLDAAERILDSTLPRLGPDALASTYPFEVEGRTMPTRIFLWRLAVHLAYHLGQAMTLRRSQEGAAA